MQFILSLYSLTHPLTHSMQQRPSWQANRISASQEIPRILWNPKVHYRICKCPPAVPIMSQLNPFHTLHPTSWRPIWLLSFHLGLGLPSDLFPSGFPTNTLYSPPHTCYMHHTSHHSRFDLPNNMGEEYRTFSSSLRSYLHSSVTSSLLGLNTFLSTLFSDTLSLRSSLSVTDHVIFKIYMFKSIMGDKIFCTVSARNPWI